MNTVDHDNSNLFMGLALELAHTAFDNDEVPVGAVIVQRRNSEVLAAFSNQMRGIQSSIAHAEMLAIQKAMQVIHNERLIDCDMYVSLEPCPMCAGALYWSRIGSLIYGASDSKRGYTSISKKALLHPKTKVVSGVLETACSEILSTYFKLKR